MRGSLLAALKSDFSFEPLLEHLKEISKFELAAFVNSQLIVKVAVAGSQPVSQDQEVRLVGAFREVGATNRELIQSIVNSETLSGINDTVYRFQSVKGIDYGVVTVPLLDFSGRNIGVIVAVQSFEEFQHQAKSMLLTLLSITVLEVILIAGVILLVINGLLLRPILALNEQLAMAVKGKLDYETDLSKRKDEVGLVAQNCQKLQHKLVEYAQDNKGDFQNDIGNHNSVTSMEHREHE